MHINIYLPKIDLQQFSIIPVIMNLEIKQSLGTCDLDIHAYIRARDGQIKN